MKKFLSILLTFSIVISAVSLPMFASAEYEEEEINEEFIVLTDGSCPESEHNYKSNSMIAWRYIHPTYTEGLFVTFSEDSYFETSICINEEEYYKPGDYLEIYAEGYCLGTFTGDELASKTIYIPGRDFWLDLYTDESVEEYGFKVESISTELPEGKSAICYNLVDGADSEFKFYECYTKGEETPVVFENLDFSLREYNTVRNGSKYRYGWSVSPDGGFDYEDGDEIVTDETVLNLYGLWEELSITADETYSFSNNGYAFNVIRDSYEPASGYYITKDDYLTLFSYALIYCLPTEATALLTNLVFVAWSLLEWQGSCFGMSATVFLQHYGAIDILSRDEGAETVREMSNTPSLISAINYYQMAQLYFKKRTSHSSDNPGSPVFGEHLRRLCETVDEGNPALFSYIYKDEKYGHATIATGGYTDRDGNHVILLYDPNNDNYACSDYSVEKIIISPDYSRAYAFGDEIGEFFWTDEYEHFDSFNINGEGSSDVWYKTAIATFIESFKVVISVIPEFFAI